jgi:protein disulfide-isomerase A1
LNSMRRGVDIARRRFPDHPTYSSPADQTRSLAPKYDELAQLYTSNPTFNDQVTIAKVDATANDVPDEISGFPTIKLFPAGSKDAPVDYQGSRTVEDLAKFVKENGKYKVDAYVVNDTEDADMTDVDETMPKQAPAATADGAAESVKSVASEAAEVVKTMVADSDDGGKEAHDEL